MASRDPRIDAYIAKSADFAKPILTHLRDIVHAAVPTVEETIKWGMPFFMYNGKILCSIAAFKQHCSLHFWKGREILGADAIGAEGMGQFGKIKSISDLPSKKVLSGYLKRATELHESIAKSPQPKKARAAKPAIPLPPDFRTALGKNGKAKT